MDELPNSVAASGPFDEREALAELDRIRQEIARYQALRAGVNEEFERFVQSFRKPERLAAPIAYAPAPPPPRAEAVPVVVPVEAAPVAVPVEEAPATLPMEPIQAAAEPPPPVIEALPSTAPFEPLNLEPFAKHFETAPTVIEHPPAHTQAVPTSPEAFEAAPEADEFEEAFAPAAAFDSLPPPLEPIAFMPPPPVEVPHSHTRTWFVVAGMIAIVSVGGYVWTHRDGTPVVVSEDPAPAAQPAPATPPPATTTEPAPATASAAVPAEPPPPFELVTTSAAWVRVLADGARVVERELPANSRIPITAQKTVQIRTGNAGAVRVSIAGVDQGALGREGEVVNRTFKVSIPVR